MYVYVEGETRVRERERERETERNSGAYNRKNTCDYKYIHTVDMYISIHGYTCMYLYSFCANLCTYLPDLTNVRLQKGTPCVESSMPGFLERCMCNRASLKEGLAAAAEA